LGQAGDLAGFAVKPWGILVVLMLIVKRYALNDRDAGLCRLTPASRFILNSEF
jgi:hypothetical protein